mmetsp:Transcript_10726/g.41673  ORF Transcript_10726/g.41673 Transcript_10726/m.41673 type:complete len:212 (+) Transcript_10726:1079-1714(+)
MGLVLPGRAVQADRWLCHHPSGGGHASGPRPAPGRVVHGARRCQPGQEHGGGRHCLGAYDACVRNGAAAGRRCPRLRHAAARAAQEPRGGGRPARSDPLSLDPQHVRRGGSGRPPLGPRGQRPHAGRAHRRCVPPAAVRPGRLRVARPWAHAEPRHALAGDQRDRRERLHSWAGAPRHGPVRDRPRRQPRSARHGARAAASTRRRPRPSAA